MIQAFTANMLAVKKKKKKSLPSPLSQYLTSSADNVPLSKIIPSPHVQPF